MSQAQCILATMLLASIVAAQQPGELTPEIHPLLSSQTCTTTGGCTTLNSSIVLDANYRWLHSKGGYTNCITTGFNRTLCPDISTCASNCVLEGVDYSSYGISTSGESLSLNLFVQENNLTSLKSPRVYLLANATTYQSFQLLNREFTFTVDVSAVPCGINGALYFSEMSPSGDFNSLNTAGAAYGTGYCDAQCPVQNFILGEANLEGRFGACCNEMDIWEANNAATAFTPHPCNATQVTVCEGTECGQGEARYEGLCDADGCDYNAYRMGERGFYGAGMVVDTMRPFTVVTQFLTGDNTETGALMEIRRVYVQDGVVVQNAVLSTPGVTPGNSITDGFCKEQKVAFNGTNAFAARGGMEGMGAALGRGMVLALSIWDDSGSEMLWLDSTYPVNSTEAGTARGPCSADSGDPAMLMAKYADAKVVFSGIKSGEIGSTFSAGSM